jgi:hypothetical protein
VRHIGSDRILAAGYDRHTGRDRHAAGRSLAAHQRDRFGRRADEGHAGVATRSGEVFVLGEEAVTRVNGICSACARSVENRVDAQVTFGRGVAADRDGFIGHAHMARGAIAFGKHRHRREACVAACANHAHRDLPAVGDEDLAQDHANSIRADRR